MLSVDAKAEPSPLGEATLWAVRRHDGSILRGSTGCALMAVLNLTPDSFSDGGKFFDAERARSRIDELIAQGADLIDIGAESTRPGATALSADEEWRRLAPLFALLDRVALKVALSIDTRHAATAKRAAEHGVTLLNLPFPQDLLPSPTSLRGTSAAAARPELSELRRLLLRFDAIAVMHARGTPATMREQTDYGDNLCQTVVEELRAIAASLAGDDSVLRRRLIFDPGLGFAKTAEQSIELLSRTAWLQAQLQAPLLIGASRKSMLGAVTGLPVESRLIPSVVAAAWAAQQGAAIVRVHDVAETRAALKLVAALRTVAEKPLCTAWAGAGSEPRSPSPASEATA
jgi:dihydropteroate synthase